MSVQSRDQCFPDASSLVHPQPNPCCKDSQQGQEGKSICLVKSSSVRQCLGFESEAGVLSCSDYNLLYETIEGLQSLECSKSKKKKGFKARRKMCNQSGTEKRRENVSGRRQACNCAASFAADCAAICCCPCAILHIFVLAFVKAPSVFARKALCFVKKKARSRRKLEQKKTNDDESGDDNREKSRCYTPPWSCAESPERRAPLDGSLSPKFDSQKIWSEFYAAGRMGFGGLPFEWNEEP